MNHPRIEPAVELPVKTSAPALEHAWPAAFRAEQMTRAEWQALLDAFHAARRAYRQSFASWHGQGPRVYGALTRARHESRLRGGA